MKDIVESLRLASPYPNPNCMLRNAANEIVRLRKELEESNAAWRRALKHAINETKRLRESLDEEALMRLRVYETEEG